MPTTGRPRRLATLAASLLLAVGALSGCGGQSGETTTIRYQSQAGGVDVIQLADALGYLKGLKLKKIGDVTGGPQSVQALTSRQIDISASCFFGSIAQVVATGAPIKAVVSTYGSNQKISSQTVTLAGSSITDAKALIGKKVAVNTLGANAEAVLDTWLEKSGLSKSQIKQVTLVPLPPLNMIQALQGHQVDAAVIGSGTVKAAESTGVKLQPLVKDTDVVGDYNGGGAAMMDQFLKQNPTTSRTLVTGVAKAVRYIESHDRAEVLKVYDAWLRKNGYAGYVEAVDQNWAGTTGVATSTTAAIKDKDVSIWLDWLSSRGDVDPTKIKDSDVYTNQYNDLAKG
ncbi:ABC transporter substrate-binding protein [Nocardioides mangrovicus]|uniref:ABC transporter substrate-binding protein n=1 Tax=Nocardioides mangrovicus TaxID=2478913 RepID=A0A3L8P241_9ACTN|nr:ABC transporter substrate-binding protein [Nocardioides mangrovicus]RLV49224.1 ABC transporter substrate-binding protein [Nocardioides mangrovicus]